MALFKTTVIFRGATAIFLVTFLDQNGLVVQPPSAQVSVSYNAQDGTRADVLIDMLPPGASGGDPVQWLAEWDSRGALAGEVYWSIHSGVPIPVAVQDGQFNLSANPANLLSF